MTDYGDFLRRKAHVNTADGFDPVWMPDFLFDFQRQLVTWALCIGRSALFEDCGLGKTPQQLVWAENVVRHTNRPVLVLTPLAVGIQTMREASKFDIDAVRSADGKPGPGITVTNYEKLHMFDPNDYSGIVCDESSILKSYSGATRAAVTQFMRPLRYRLLCTATAAPNDYTELGTSSEALGHLGFMDMLSRFFRNNRNNAAVNPLGHSGLPQWRFRGHAEKPFWRWVSSWARCLRKPSDLGFDDSRFDLPPLTENEHVVDSDKFRAGMLFAVPAVGLQEQREERRRTLADRCDRAASLVADTGKPAVCWAHLNDEADLIERMVPDAVQVAGRHSDDIRLERFTAFLSGEIRVLVTKPKIGAWGLNWQHCAHTTMFSSHSFEQYYQSVRRFWRFGQTQPVVVDHVRSEGEARVLSNLRRKARLASKMFDEVTAHMRNALVLSREQRVFDTTEEVPKWL